MCKIIVLTATYNHPNQLKMLYNSLVEQNNKAFTWLIVDDGSEETTKRQVDLIINEQKVKTIYIRKANGGKASAVNTGLDYIVQHDYDFVVFVDDDEKMLPNFIDIIYQYIAKYEKSNCGVIHFNRLDEKGNVISNPVFTEDHIMTCQERKRKKYIQDGYTGYFVKRLGDLRFPHFEGEKYVGPSVLFMMLCNRGYDMVWAYVAIGQTEYLENGITRQGRRLRVKNPKGMYIYCLLLQHKDSGLFLKLVYSIYGYAYLSYGGIKESSVKERIKINSKLIPIAKPLGLLLAEKWKIQFRKQPR